MMVDDDIMTQKAEIRGQLGSFRDHNGKLKVDDVLVELYVEAVLTQRRTALCPVTAGKMTFKDAHGNQFFRWVKQNPWKFFGGLLLIVAILVPASLAAEILHLGGI